MNPKRQFFWSWGLSVAFVFGAAVDVLARTDGDGNTDPEPGARYCAYTVTAGQPANGNCTYGQGSQFCFPCPYDPDGTGSGGCAKNMALVGDCAGLTCQNLNNGCSQCSPF